MQFVNQDNMIRLVLVMCTILQLSGCATTYEEVQKSYMDAPVCCKAKTEFQYEKIRIGGSKEILIEEDDQAFLFDSGKSYFKAFELPSPSQPYHVQVESLVQVNTSIEGFEGYYVFYPTLMTLDQSYNVVRTSDPQTFQLKKLRYGFKLVGQLPFTSKEDEEKYLIILTTGESMNKYTNLRSPFYYPSIEKSAKDSPGGVIVLSLTTPSNLNKDNRIK